MTKAWLPVARITVARTSAGRILVVIVFIIIFCWQYQWNRPMEGRVDNG
jgi:hypothetical protein